MLHIEPRHMEIVKSILSKYPYGFYAFGSRAKGNEKKFSDLDLCFFEDIPFRDLSTIATDFEESDLPFKVDVVNWNKCQESFQDLITGDLVCIQESKLNNHIPD
jgi:predicted nucleotidyltransferase